MLILFAGLLFGLAGAAHAQDDPDSIKKGAQAYRVCAACHSLKPDVHLSGPSLAGRWGKEAGSVPDFTRYTEALKNSGLVWEESSLDGWLAETAFGWMPATLTELATVDSGGETLSGAALAVTVVAVFILNGFVGPITEELYFRGHLLPRLDRFGKGAPVLNTVLFSLYHFWTPWQNLARILGFLPTTWMTWRTRSIYVSLAAHVLTNTVFVLLLLSLVLGAAS
jgi:membrane protease YdiL (CAAX protease family)